MTMHRMESVVWGEKEIKEEGELIWYTDHYYYCVCGEWMTEIERQTNEFENTERDVLAFREHLEASKQEREKNNEEDRA